MVVNQQHKEFLREAEQSRLLKAARPQGSGYPWTSTFRAVSSHLVEWSSRLNCLAHGYLAAIAGDC
jgi:hypothetical protein